MSDFQVRPIAAGDFENWLPLWQGYVDFFGSDIEEQITRLTFDRALDPVSSIGCFVADDGEGAILGFVTYVFHPTTFAEKDRLYLEDLFTAADQRGKGVARGLINAVIDIGEQRGADQVYWQTSDNNYAGRMLYDKMAEKTRIIYVRKLTS